jgi:hypothetical protein
LTGEDRGGGEKVNNTPHPDPLPQSGEGRKRKDLTTPLTFILSRRGREKILFNQKHFVCFHKFWGF